MEKKIFKKIIFEIFFRKKVFFKSQNAEKLKKRPFRLIQRFLQTENFKKKCKGVPFDKFQKFSKKSHIVPKKTQRGGPLVSPVLLEALKNLWFSARIEPTHSGWVEDGR